jgi:TetR/AcrR family transcriptional regulator, lmrAB and yxaGH operons repressor
MAREVLEAAQSWLEDQVLGPLRRPGDPATRLAAMAKKVDEFYAGGRQACLLNMLSSGRNFDGPFAAAIKGMFQAWISAFAAVAMDAMDAGADKKAARMRAERVIALMQGSLVLSRGLGTPQPFRDFIKSAPAELRDFNRACARMPVFPGQAGPEHLDKCALEVG